MTDLNHSEHYCKEHQLITFAVAAPGKDGYWASCPACDRQRIRELERLLRIVAWEDLDADAADAVTVLQVVVKEAQQLVRPSLASSGGQE